MALAPAPSGSYTLTNGEAEYLKRSNSYDSCHLGASPSITVSSFTEDGEKVYYTNSGDGRIRCRYMRIAGTSDKERNSSLHATLRLTRRWRDMALHPNVVAIRGYEVITESLDGREDGIPHLSLISGHIEHTLKDYIQSNTPYDRLKLCLGIVAGLDRIHCHSIVHGAIRTSNILVKNDGTACLGEFSDERKPTTDTLTQYANYIAPELVDVSKLYKITVDHYREMEYEGEYRTASDIFALGCVMIEVYTGAPPEPLRIPYEKLKDYAELANLRRTPTSHEQEIPPKILSILQAMLQYIPLRRPNSGLAKTWLENPDGLRLTATVPVLAKRQLWPAFREMTRISP